MTLKDVPPMEWHNFKFKCPNMRKLYNELQTDNKKLKKEIDDLNRIFYAVLMGDEMDLPLRLQKKAEEMIAMM